VTSFETVICSENKLFSFVFVTDTKTNAKYINGKENPWIIRFLITLFLIRIMGSGVQLGPLGTPATE
jgi:hypothetical protein